MSRYLLLILNGVILTGCAVFIYPARTTILTTLLLLLPLLDRSWLQPALLSLKDNKHILTLPLVLATLFSLFLALHPELTYTAITILFLVALPEEWFFRAYFMTRIESIFEQRKIPLTHAKWLANIITSLFFAMTHFPTQGVFGLSVFFPSLFYGWLYQRQKNLVLVIFLHAISNVVFIVYIRDYLNTYL